MKLYYFDIHGRAEPIRLLLHYANVEFEDVRLKRSGFEKLRDSGKLEFRQIPVLEINGKAYAQSQSILRMLGKMYGYYPKDIDEAWKVDSNPDANKDIQEKYWEYELAQKDDKPKKLDEYINNHLQFYYTVMEERLLKNSSQKYMVGNSMTIADFDNAHIAYTYALNDKNPIAKQQREVLDKFVDLKNYYVGLHDQMKTHFDKRPERPY